MFSRHFFRGSAKVSAFAQQRIALNIVGRTGLTIRPFSANFAKLGSKVTAGARIPSEELPVAINVAEAIVGESSGAEETPKSSSTPDFGDAHYDYIIVGAGLAAQKAIEGIRQHDENGKILVVSKETDPLYVRPPLSKELWKSTPEELEQLVWTDIHGEKGSLKLPRKEDPNLEIRIGEVADLDAQRRAILIGEDYIATYNNCLIATGASPRPLQLVKSEDSELIGSKVQTFRTLEDFRTLLAATANPALERIAVIGGGVLGTELTFALAQKVGGDKVVQVFPEAGPMANVLPSYLSNHINKELENLGTAVRAGLTVLQATSLDGKIKLDLSDGSDTIVDHIVVAAGVLPNTALAKRAELEIDPVNGGIVANAELQVRTGLYAAGDVVSYYDIIADRRMRFEHFDTAHYTGFVAGENMAGQHRPYLHHTFWWSDCGPNVALEVVGIADSRLQTVGVFEEPEGQFKRGVVYYLSNEKEQGPEQVVGVALYNLFDRVEQATEIVRKVLPGF